MSDTFDYETTACDEILSEKNSCNHIFNGKVWYSEDGRTGSVTCSKCGLPEIYYDLRRLP
jgi:hypothetical protein